ncbi:expressed unknown protein [Seminavis robusta]|uniref:Uncharacterized protein n=1 Tax=Seminavis robusta TaxID=568900 RepID=A0A9N8HWM2_9STRA|nr:expressed unknown protein [Seminavis robusta]|eukprot:Sro2711_g335270.1 n/a (338) ;mRNA; r:10407-11420
MIDSQHDENNDDEDDPSISTLMILLEDEEEAMEDASPDDESGESSADPLHVDRLLSPQRDARMELTDQEHAFALEIKRAVMENTGCQDDVDLSSSANFLTDMEYATFAISSDSLAEALHRVERMQTFRDHYGIHHSVEQGLARLMGIQQQQPGFCLHIDSDPEANTAVNVIDFGSYDPDLSLSSDQHWQTYITGLYYMKYAAALNLASVRNGLFAMADFGRIQVAGLHPEAWLRVFTELMAHFPINWHIFMAYNTGYAATTILALAKRIIPWKATRAMQAGCRIVDDQCDGTNGGNPMRHLAEFYLLPDLETANANLLARAETMLRERIHKEQTFRL